MKKNKKTRKITNRGGTRYKWSRTEGASFIFTHDDVYYIARWYKKLCTLSTTSSSCARFRVFFFIYFFFVYTRRPCVKFFKMLISENAREARSPGNKKIITPRRRYFNPFFHSKTNTKGGCTPVGSEHHRF